MGIGSWRTLSEMRLAAAKNAAKDAKAIILLQAENERLAPPSTPLALPPPATSPTTDSKPTLGVQRVEALGLLTDLARRGYFATPTPMILLFQLSRALPPNVRKVPQPAYMIDANGNFGPGFAEFFGLTGSEEASLQAGLSTWKDDMDRAIQTRTTVRRADDSSVILEVNPVDEAAAMRERFTALLKERLGAERFRLFKDLNSGPRPVEEEALPAIFTGNANFFGEASATYTVKRSPTGVSVDYKLKSPDGSNTGSGGGNGGSSMNPEALREQLIKAHGPVMKLLPVDF